MQFTGKHFRYYHINSICQELGEDKARPLPFFPGFSGSDATSQFNGKGKKTIWTTRKSYSTATVGFAITYLNVFVPLEVTSAAFNMIERFTCTMYDTTTSHVKVNDLRQEMLPTRVKMMEQLPPTHRCITLRLLSYIFLQPSTELADILPSEAPSMRATRFSVSGHPCCVHIPRSKTELYFNSYISRTSRLWNSLPAPAFPASPNMATFKTGVNAFLLDHMF